MHTPLLLIPNVVADAPRAPLLKSGGVQYKLPPLTDSDEHSYRLPSPPRNPRVSSFARKPALRKSDNALTS
jgi:hypothetical protein